MKINAKVLLLSLFIAVAVVASASLAEAKPGWVKTSVKSIILVKCNPNADINKPGYWCLIVKVNHINQSKEGRIITQMYDKSINATFSLAVWGTTYNVTRSSKFTAVTDVDKGYPGQTYEHSYRFPLNDKFWLEKLDPTYRQWKSVNNKLADAKQLKVKSFVYDFQIRSTK